jgi:hypothetical protein
MIYNNRAGDGVTITSPAFNVSREKAMLEYEELVEMIAHIKAAQAVVGLDPVDGIVGKIMLELHDAQNNLNGLRLRALGNGLDRPYQVGEIVQQ